MKKKLELEAIKIQSFVTSLENGESKNIRGGAYTASCDPEGETCDAPCIPPTYEYVYCTGLNGCTEGYDCRTPQCF
jgi:hypothetical protein